MLSCIAVIAGDRHACTGDRRYFTCSLCNDTYTFSYAGYPWL